MQRKSSHRLFTNLNEENFAIKDQKEENPGKSNVLHGYMQSGFHITLLSR